MSANKHGKAERHNDSVDASLTPLDDVGDGAPAGGAEVDQDAAAAALRLDMLGANGDVGEPPKRSMVGSQNALLLVVLLAAAGALFAMRFLGMGPKSSLARELGFKMPQYDVDRPRDTTNSDHKKVIAELSESRISAQVPTELVQRNPFEMEGVIKAAAPKALQVVGESPEERAKRLLAAAILAASKTLTVNSVLIGAVPVARINGDLVKIGDTVAEYFEVKDIHGRGVVLGADGKTYELEVPEGHGGGLSPKRPAPAPRK
jgi:hypothetical protein